MIKIKVFQTNEPLLRDLSLSKINSLSYNDEDGFGFIIQDDFSDYCKVQYVEKNTIERQIETPQGDVNIIQEVTYYKFIFILRYTSYNSIVFINPPKNIKYASDIVRGIVPEKCQVSQLKINLKNTIENIKHKYKGKLKSATLSNIFYDNQTQAKTKINSVDDLYIFYCDNFLETIAKVDSAIFDINGKLYELTDSGRITFQSDNIDFVFDLI